MSGRTRKRKPASETGTGPDALSFEEALDRLESLVGRLEEGKISLEESLSAYVEGTRLVKHCQERLDHAETVIRELAETQEGFELEPSSLSEEADEGVEDDGEEDDDDEEDR